jgi:predicted ATPase
MKLNSLHIKNFRLLEDLQIPQLGRVNLIVGKNNSGKSTVLEALRIYAQVAHPAVLVRISREHDELVLSKPSDLDTAEDTNEFPWAHFFHGRIVNLTSKIYIGETGAETSGLRISYVQIRVAPSVPSEIYHPSSLTECLKIDRHSEQQIVSNFSLDFASQLSVHPNKTWFSDSRVSLGYIPTKLPDINQLAQIWDSIALTDNQSVVLQSLQSVEPDVENLIFVEKDAGDADEDPREARSRRARPRTAKVKLKGSPRPVPLQSLGDGMLRVLQLALKAFPAKGGFFLIDEVENGLHYSVQERIWRQLFDLAENLDMQIFATTHSWDCIESFAKVAAEKSDTRSVLFRMGRSIRKSDHGKIIATSFTGEELTAITQADVEVR